MPVEIVRTQAGSTIPQVPPSGDYPYAAGNPIPDGLLVDFGKEITNVNASYRVVSYSPTDSGGRWSNIGDNGKHSFSAVGAQAGQSYGITYEIDAYSASASPTTGSYRYDIT